MHCRSLIHTSQKGRRCIAPNRSEDLPADDGRYRAWEREYPEYRRKLVESEARGLCVAAAQCAPADVHSVPQMVPSAPRTRGMVIQSVVCACGSRAVTCGVFRAMGMEEEAITFETWVASLGSRVDDAKGILTVRSASPPVTSRFLHQIQYFRYHENRQNDENDRFS